MGANATQVNHAFYARLLNGLCIVIGKLAAMCHRVKVGIGEVWLMCPNEPVITISICKLFLLMG